MLEEAKKILDVLAFYDIFQYENNVKPDYSNAGGLQIWNDNLDKDENGEKWQDWIDDETGYDIDEYFQYLEEENSL